MAASTTNINNLNVLTFIKDIYLSMKHIDTCFNTHKESIDKRIQSLEDMLTAILDKLNTIEQAIYNLDTNTQKQNTIDSKIESELLAKMTMLSFNSNTHTNKLVLKPNELTFANILENNYNLGDLQDIENINADILDTNITIQQDYKIPYLGDNINHSIKNNNNNNNNNNNDNNNNNNNNDNNNNDIDTLNSLLF